MRIKSNNNNNNKKKLYDPFLWMGFNCLKVRATSRRLQKLYCTMPFFQKNKRTGVLKDPSIDLLDTLMLSVTKNLQSQS